MQQNTPAESKYFRGFFHWKLRIFYLCLLGIPKDDEIVYNNFFEKLKTSGSHQNIPHYARDILHAKLVSGTLCKVKIL